LTSVIAGYEPNNAIALFQEVSGESLNGRLRFRIGESLNGRLRFNTRESLNGWFRQIN
jgi:hypothetical protein